MTNPEPKRMARREAVKIIIAAAALIPAMSWNVRADADETLATGTLTDPNLFKSTAPWQLTLTQEELRTLTALCDVIIPADDKSPSASELKVPDFIDEWVSAPFPEQQSHKPVIRDGLAWLNTESKKRFQKDFADLAEDQKTQICDDICFAPKAKPEFQQGAGFFALARNLTASGFYTTREGMKDIQYIGNTALTEYAGAPKEILEKLKLA